MAFTAEDIERIVREVVRRLETASTPSGTAPAMPTQQNSSSSDSIAGQLHVSLPVVSVERLTGKLSGVKQVVVSPRAVVTPAAKDLLREKKITLVRAEKVQASSNSRRTLTVGVAETNYEPAPLWREIQQEGVAVEELARTGMASVTAELCEQVTRGGRLGLLLTTKVAAAVCLANRSRGVRAAEARCATSTRDAVKGVGVNLLVVNPTGKSTFELKRMLNVLLASDGSCPADWQGKLE